MENPLFSKICIFCIFNIRYSEQLSLIFINYLTSSSSISLLRWCCDLSCMLVLVVSFHKVCKKQLDTFWPFPGKFLVNFLFALEVSKCRWLNLVVWWTYVLDLHCFNLLWFEICRAALVTDCMKGTETILSYFPPETLCVSLNCLTWCLLSVRMQFLYCYEMLRVLIVLISLWYF